MAVFNEGADTTNVSTRTVAALETLRSLLGDDVDVDRIVTIYSTWSDLYAAAQNKQLVGATSKTAVIPSRPDPAIGMLDGMDVFTRYDSRFPQNLLALRHLPVLIYVQGNLPTTPSIGVFGSENPSPIGIEVARNVGLTAAASNVTVIARTDNPIGRTALLENVRAGGKPVGVCTNGFLVKSAGNAVTDEIIYAGGTIIYGSDPYAKISSRFKEEADKLVVGLADAVIPAEVGVGPGTGRAGVTAAIQAAKPLIVPELDTNPVAGRFIPDTMAGCEVLTQPSRFSSDFFGTNNKIDNRVRVGLPPADYVVVTGADIAKVLNKIASKTI